MPIYFDILVDKAYTAIMIEEKIKLRITEYIARIIYNDCFAFDFTRNSDQPNINGFLNKLIPNLVRNRKDRRDIIHNTMCEALEFIANVKSQEKLYRYMDTVFDKIYFADDEYILLTEEIWIRPNKGNITTFDEISESELDICQMDISTYLRSLLNEYARLPQYQRELLVFAEELNLIRLSIETDRLLNFKYKNQKYSMTAINYFSEFLYDQNNYIIGYDTISQKIKSLKLCEIKNIYILAKKQHLADSVYQTYHKIAENFEFDKKDTFDIIGEEA